MMMAAGSSWLACAPGVASGDAAGEIRACLADNAVPSDCSGMTIDDCTAEPGGETTVGIVACVTAESDVWDAILNDEYQTTMSAFREQDATGDISAPDMTREGTLRDAQRAWIAFRDAECRAQYARWGGGTMRQIAGANCVMSETAERAIELRQMREP